MSGLIQQFCVESDDMEVLVNSIRILQSWHSKVTHYRTGNDINGVPYLCLMWAAGDKKPNVIPLMAELKSPDAIAHQIYAWLQGVEYPERPDIDGDSHKGFRVTYDFDNPVLERREVSHPLHPSSYDVCDSSFYDFAVFRPRWIEYHK